MSLLKFLLSLAFLGAVFGHAPTPKLENYNGMKKPIPDSDKYAIYWKVDGDSITFEMQGQTLGYVGFGISPKGSMVDSDIIIGWVTNGTAMVKDYYSDKNTMPKTDASDDVTLVDGKEENGYTVITFRRKLTTGDANAGQDKDINTGDMKLIYAIGPVDMDSTSKKYHGHDADDRGSYTAALRATTDNGATTTFASLFTLMILLLVQLAA